MTTLLIAACVPSENRAPASVDRPAPSGSSEESEESEGGEPAVAQINGIRLDPGYLYDLPEYSSMTPLQLAIFVVSDIKAGGFNTIFLYGYSSYYGAFYPTTYAQTQVESGLGKLNIFKLIADEANAQGLSVVGVLPVNDFRKAWINNPAWRVKRKNGADFKPESTVFYLSPSHPEFKSWYAGFVRDFLARNSGVSGIEAVEPGYDLFWTGAVDYNMAAVDEFKAKYPGAATGGAEWKRHRSWSLNQHLVQFTRLAHQAGKESYVVQTWTARPDGSLMTSKEISDGLGFDWNGLLDQPLGDRPDWINAEFMYQQWKAEYGASVFVPSWTSDAARSFVSFVAGRARSIIHVEYSPFTGPYGDHSAGLAEVEASLRGVLTFAQGQDVYDYALWRSLRR